MRKALIWQLSLVIAFTLLTANAPAFAQDTSFTYQGQLKLDGTLVSGQYDFRFRIYDGPDPLSATELDSHIVLNATVVEGVFTVEITVDASIFNGQPLWLQTEVRETGTIPLFVLTPLQQLTPVPYATFSINADKLDGQDSSDFLTEEVDPSLPPAVQNGCKICLGWADGNDPDPDVEKCHSLNQTSINTGNFIQFDGNVDSNDRMWLWVECI